MAACSFATNLIRSICISFRSLYPCMHKQLSPTSVMLIIHSSLSVFVFNRFNLPFPILELYLTNFPLKHTHAHARTHKHIHSHILYATHACTPKIHKQTRTHSHMFDIQHHLSLSLPSLYLRADRIFQIYVMTDTRSDAA